MTTLTDEQLMLLENLTYLNHDVDKAAGISSGLGIKGLPADGSASVADLINRYFTPNADGTRPIDELNRIDGKDVTTGTQGNEWAAILRQIHDDPDLMGMKLQATDGKTAYCWTDKDNQAVVTFQGTSGAEEWYDNMEGFDQADTKNQKEALDFIESLKYDDITCVGHSKGGNKAQYVTILSDKVNRGVSMDGQGFSQEFLDKYAAEIERKAGRISSYSLNTDYVHILMFPIPGCQNVIYVESSLSRDRVGAANHAPSSFYRYEQDANGKWVLATDDGSTLRQTKENSAVTYLHEFTCFALNTMTEEQKESVIPFLGYLMVIGLTKDGYVDIETNGKIIRYNKDNVVQYICANQDELGLVLAYLMKYVETYKLTDEQMMDLVRAFGLEKLLQETLNAVVAYAKEHPVNTAIGVALGIVGIETIPDLLRFLYGELTDGKNDPIIQSLLKWINDWLNEWLKEKFGEGPSINLERLWIGIEEDYKAIGEVPANANGNNNIVATSIYDYSSTAYNELVQTIERVASQTYGNLDNWRTVYGSEDWYSSLGVGTFISGINIYANHLESLNNECLRQIKAIFLKVDRIDRQYGSALESLNNSVGEVSSKMAEIVGRFVV